MRVNSESKKKKWKKTQKSFLQGLYDIDKEKEYFQKDQKTGMWKPKRSPTDDLSHLGRFGIGFFSAGDEFWCI